MVLMLLALACAKAATTKAPATASSAAPATTTSAAPAIQTSSTAPVPASTSSAAQASNTQANKILKIGYVGNLGGGPGLDALRDHQVIFDNVNKAGGLKVGNDTYFLQLVFYDSSNMQATAVSAINRLIFEDKVKYIISDPFFGEGWLPVTEANKVFVVMASYTQFEISPQFNYVAVPFPNNAWGIASMGWYAKNFPDAANHLVQLSPDNQMGHAQSDFQAAKWKIFGATPTWVFYPPSTQDFSADATKVMQLNPQTFSPGSGDPNIDGLLIKAVRQAGFTGAVFSGGGVPVELLALSAGWPAMEGYICHAWPNMYTPPKTNEAAEFISQWEAKFGKWEGQDGFTCYSLCLFAGMQQAGTIDVEAVKKTIQSGMEFNGPGGHYKMITRPDMGIADRTIDSIADGSMMKVVNGKAQQVGADVSWDELIGYLKGVGMQ